MASNIISATIDAEYPISGQDNDTQGFRDNFSTIKNSLEAARLEINTLQEDTAKLDESNDFAGNNILDANLSSITEEFITYGTAVADGNISFLNGHYQKFPVGDDISLNFTDWPDSGRLGKIRVEIVATGGNRTITFTSDGGGTMLYDGDFPSPFTVPENAIYVVDAWTYDSGNTVFMKYIGTFS
jgi:hypothetical protein